jgi:hypothetical protein
MRAGNGCDLGVGVADGSAQRPTLCCNPCKMARSVAGMSVVKNTGAI